jgi:CHAD domain-containing protein
MPTSAFVFVGDREGPARALEVADRVRDASPSIDARIGRSATVTRTVLDTADRRLREAGLELAIEAAESPPMLVLTGPDGVRPLRVPCPRPRRRYRVDDLPGEDLAVRLAPIVDVRALLPIVEIRRQDIPVTVLDEEAKTVVRLRVADLWVVAKGRPQPQPEPQPLRVRVEVAGVLGYGPQFALVEAALRGHPELVAADMAVVDEAVTVSGGSPGGLSSGVKVDLDRDDRAGVAARRVLRGLADVVEAQRAGTLDDLDTEFLHDLRVAIRRSRSVLRQTKRAFDPAVRREHAAGLRWVQAVTGPTRDLDVLLMEWGELTSKVPGDRRAALDPVRTLLVEQRSTALRAMKAALRSAEHRRRWTAWRLFLATDTVGRVGPDAERPIGKVAIRRVRALHARIVRDGGALTAESPAEALHEIRKQGKELRYVLELFGPALGPAAELKPLKHALKGLQDELGRHNDRDVQVKRLGALAPELATRPGGPAALLALGSLIDRLEVGQRAARANVAERFAALAQIDPRGST